MSVYERDGLWFWRCTVCRWFDGAYSTESGAVAGLRKHRTEGHAKADVQKQWRIKSGQQRPGVPFVIHRADLLFGGRP